MDAYSSGAGGVCDLAISRQDMSPLCGCQAKVPGDVLSAQLARALGADREQVDDCAVVEVGGQRLLTTLDFGPLVGTSVIRAGRIAGHHAMSDVYAMGGKPLVATAIVAASSKLHADAVGAVVAGLQQACLESGVALVGGHTIEGDEPLAGLSVIGIPGPRVLTKKGARPGDVLMISKPLGTGLVTRAYQLGLLDEPELETAMTTMESSNQTASRAAVANEVSALTDVTGFGLIGHCAEVVSQSEVGAILELPQVPVLEAAAALPAVAGFTRFIDGNLDYAESLIRLTGTVDRGVLAPLLDPQTSGGLLASVAQEHVFAMELAGFTAIGLITTSNVLEVRL